MPLRLLDVGDARTGVQYGPDSWIPSSRTLAIASVPETVVKRELWRYLREEVEGRSFLISGHRGAGKTTLVQRAVSDVSDAVLGASATGRTLPAQQRPLLVKLHGPSLFSGQLPAKGEGKLRSGGDAATKLSADDAAMSGAGGERQSAGGPRTGPPGERQSEPSAHDRTQAALVQIMAALYRALAAEVAKRFRTHAAGLGGGAPLSKSAERVGERLELAARLRLELDKAPGPDALRGFYLRLGRLRQGVLWPGSAMRSPDQGAREIVAISTAAQAFQVCIGAISYEHVSKDTGERSLKVDGKGEANLKSVLDKLSGVLAGAAIGAGVGATGAGATTATAAGIMGGVVSALTFSWTSSRTDKRDETAEYRFIRDFSLATLDRDLPEVIQRLREAGLAPVFVIDELDKLDDMRASVEELIGRLKNLTTDYGFFCFLTNRAYYEDVWWRMRQAAYPREFTYFSNLLFVRYGATEVLRYLLRIVRPVGGSGAAAAGGQAQDAAAWMTFAFAARHRSRLNSIALMRELSLAFDENGTMRAPSGRVSASVQGRLQACVQIAIDLGLGDPELSERIGADPLFAQLAVDSLYRLSAAWEAGEAEVKLGPDDLATYLKSRSDAPPLAAPAGPGHASWSDAFVRPSPSAGLKSVATTDPLTSEELDLLSRSAIRVAELLSDIGSLKREAALYWTPERRGRLLADIGPPDFVDAALAAFDLIIGVELMPTGITGIVEAGSGGRYVFRIDRYGSALPGTARLATPNGSESAESLLKTVDGLIEAFETLGVSVDAMIQANVLSPTVAAGPLTEASERVRSALSGPASSPSSLAQDVPTLRTFVAACVAAGDVLGWTIRLARAVGGTDGNAEAGLRAAVRHLHLDEVDPVKAAGTPLDDLLWEVVEGVPSRAIVPRPFEGTPESVRAWRDGMLATEGNLPPTGGIDVDPSASWEGWRPRVLQFLASPGPPVAAASFADLVQASRGIWPGALLRRHLGEVTVEEWSALVRSAGPFSTGSRRPARAKRRAATDAPAAGATRPPPWAFVAALAALGFDRDIVSAAADLVGEKDELATLIASVRVKGPDDKGVLWLQADAAPGLAGAPLRRVATGILAVAKADLPRYSGLLGWMNEQGAFQVIGGEDGQEHVGSETRP